MALVSKILNQITIKEIDSSSRLHKPLLHKQYLSESFYKSNQPLALQAQMCQASTQVDRRKASLQLCQLISEQPEKTQIQLGLEGMIGVHNDPVSLNGMPDALKAILQSDPSFFSVIKQGIAKQAELARKQGLPFWCYPPSGLLYSASNNKENNHKRLNSTAIMSKLNVKNDPESLLAQMPDPRQHLIGIFYNTNLAEEKKSHRRSLSSCALSRYKQKEKLNLQAERGESSRHISSYRKVDMAKLIRVETRKYSTRQQIREITMGGSMDTTTDSSVKRPNTSSQIHVKKHRRSKVTLKSNHIDFTQKEQIGSRNSNFATQAYAQKACTQGQGGGGGGSTMQPTTTKKQASKQRRVLMIQSMSVKVKEGSIGPSKEKAGTKSSEKNLSKTAFKSLVNQIKKSHAALHLRSKSSIYVEQDKVGNSQVKITKTKTNCPLDKQLK